MNLFYVHYPGIYRYKYISNCVGYKKSITPFFGYYFHLKIHLRVYKENNSSNHCQIAISQSAVDKRKIGKKIWILSGGWNYYMYILRVHAHIDVITCVTLFIGYVKWCMASDCMVLYLHLRSFETEKISLKLKEMECIEWENEWMNEWTKKDTMSMLHDGAYE